MLPSEDSRVIPNASDSFLTILLTTLEMLLKYKLYNFLYAFKSFS